jgi:oxidative stress regulatory protein oxyR
MQTHEIKKALEHGDIDVGILAELDGMGDFETTHLYFEQFFGYVAKDDPLYINKVIHTTDLKGEYLWMLDEGHCFRDQLVKFCQLKEAKQSQKAYSLGSIETFMRIVENGKGMTFIPELAILQLADSQKELVRPFAIPIPTRDIVIINTKDFVRHKIRKLLVDAIQSAVPSDMLKLKQIQQRV